ncbi:stage V sporulation protein T [Salipaludibacillus keqinensis]|uniref:Stage V sporulation protein T n=1 Tax=Salipaludibacillus keqinensis TaxID=2045207 RepID=A0A323TGA7_9BACI|nr:stage V sporulation protein T [Salipaludibacillus keqinensis]PYZ91583.1 stage V sporulation protein T [Salipaludibacillus keqinensis]
MKATGIVRRIDDLGRVVIPKEIRRTLRIREGDPLEIFVDRDGEVILKKYSPISELGDFAKEYAEALYDSLNHIVLIADRDTYIAVAGGSKKDYHNKPISDLIEKSMDGRSTDVQSSPGDYVIQGDMNESLDGYCIAPIIANGDPIGAVVLVSKGSGKIGEVEQKLSETAAGFLARQMEQ